MKKLFLTVLSTLLYSAAFSTVITSVTNGAWNNATTWDNGVPVCGDTIYIVHIVQLTATADYSGCTDPMFIEISGTLNFSSNGRKLHLPVGSGVEIGTGGMIIGSGGGGGNSTTLTIDGVIVWRKNDGTQTAGTTYGSPLPIELIDFNAVFTDSCIKLYWSTASKLNNEYFTIFKSRDGETWEELIQVNGA